jgi:hypothetical protein
VTDRDFRVREYARSCPVPPGQRRPVIGSGIRAAVTGCPNELACKH